MAVPHPGGTNITTSTTSFIIQWFSMITSVRLGLSVELLFARVPLDRVSCSCVHGALCSVMLPRFGGFIAKRVVLWGRTHCEHSTYGVEATRDTLRGTSPRARTAGGGRHGAPEAPARSSCGAPEGRVRDCPCPRVRPSCWIGGLCYFAPSETEGSGALPACLRSKKNQTVCCIDSAQQSSRHS